MCITYLREEFIQVLFIYIAVCKLSFINKILCGKKCILT